MLVWVPLVKSGGRRSQGENSFATKLFLQPTNARRTDTHTRIRTAQDGYTHTPRSLACVVSCWRLVALLFVGSPAVCVCVCVGGGSPKRRVKVRTLCSCVCRWSSLEGGNHKAKTRLQPNFFCNQPTRGTDTHTHTSPLSLVLYPAGAS